MKTTFVLILACLALRAQNDEQPSVAHAQLEVRAYRGSLASEITAVEPTWFGYEIRTPQRDWNNENQNCMLEENRQANGARASEPIRLEGSDKAALLFRVADTHVDKIRLYPLGCVLDAAGRRFVWMTGVSDAASLAFLEKLATGNTAKDLQNDAVFAIAQHATPAADDVLERWVKPGQPAHLREQVTFWLGAARGARGFAMLKDILANDASEQERDKAVFAISISKQPEAMNVLSQTAEHDRSAHVRGQALFWLAQKAGAKASRAIVNAIDNDPNTDVKKKAVFALSQLPPEESVPKLIEIARTQRNPEVRKQAFFWLGQSHDPRALAFFKQVLAQ